MHDESYGTVLERMSQEDREKLLLVDLGRLFDEEKLLRHFDEYLTNRDEDSRKKLARLVFVYSMAWQSHSSGTIGSVVTRMLARDFLTEMPSMKVLKEDADWEGSKEYFRSKDAGAKVEIEVGTIFEKFKEEIRTDPNNSHLRRMTIDEIPAEFKEWVFMQWKFALDTESIKKRLEEIQEEREKLQKMLMENLSSEK